MEASKKIVVGYAVHDIIGNNEQCLTEYDPEVLQSAEDAGSCSSPSTTTARARSSRPQRPQARPHGQRHPTGDRRVRR